MEWNARKYIFATSRFLASYALASAIAVIFIILMSTSTSCKKESTDVFLSSVDSTDTVWVDNSTTDLKNDFQQLLDTLTTLPTEYPIDDIKKNQTFNAGNSFTIDLPPKGFEDKNGKNVEGPAKVAIIYLDSRGEMLKNKISGTSNDQALKTVFAARIAFYQGGKELTIASHKKVGVFINQSNPQTGLQLYTGQPGADHSNWVTFQDGEITTVSRTTKKGYDLELKQLPWILAGEAYNAVNPTTITATLPNIFTNANSKIYVLLNDRNGLLEMQQEKNSKSFFADNIPDGVTAKLISVSSISNTFYLGTDDVEIKKKQHVKLKPRIVSFAELQTFMNSLN